MIYLDTSALAKLLIVEAETPELQAWLAARSGSGEHAATSVVGRIELMRVVARYGQPTLAGNARCLLDGIDIIALTEPVVTLAETIGPATLRSLDALHLAAAMQIQRELRAFVTYDHRLLAGCGAVGLTAVSPGR